MPRGDDAHARGSKELGVHHGVPQDGRGRDEAQRRARAQEEDAVALDRDNEALLAAGERRTAPSSRAGLARTSKSRTHPVASPTSSRRRPYTKHSALATMLPRASPMGDGASRAQAVSLSSM